jgi:hypothetical protein
MLQSPGPRGSGPGLRREPVSGSSDVLQLCSRVGGRDRSLYEHYQSGSRRAADARRTVAGRCPMNTLREAVWEYLDRSYTVSGILF